MELTSRSVGAITVLTAEGELTVRTAPAFLRRACLLLASGPPPLLAVDLGRVRPVDSSGFAALVALLRRIQRRRGEVCLVGLDGEARLLLELMQLHLLFDVCDDVPAAIEILAAHPAVAPPVAAAPRGLLGRIRAGSSPLPRRAAS